MSLLQGITQFTEELQKRNITFGIIGGLPSLPMLLRRKPRRPNRT